MDIINGAVRKKKASEKRCEARESVFHLKTVFRKILPSQPGKFPITTVGGRTVS